MTTPNDGGPAYLITPAQYAGLTKREVFAMAAMQGLLANNGVEPTFTSVQQALDYYADLSVGYADALLAALSEPTTKRKEQSDE